MMVGAALFCPDGLLAFGVPLPEVIVLLTGFLTGIYYIFIE
jgi:hypothetical protein